MTSSAIARLPRFAVAAPTPLAVFGLLLLAAAGVNAVDPLPLYWPVAGVASYMHTDTVIAGTIARRPWRRHSTKRPGMINTGRSTLTCQSHCTHSDSNRHGRTSHVAVHDSRAPESKPIRPPSILADAVAGSGLQRVAHAAGVVARGHERREQFVHLPVVHSPK